MIINNLRIHPDMLEDDDVAQWPWSVPCVRSLIGPGIDFKSSVTFLVGENGAGKSTLIEAIAEAYGIDPYGGKAGGKYASPRSKSILGEHLRIGYETPSDAVRQRGSRRGFFLRAETAFEMMERIGQRMTSWEGDTSLMSHGEGFMTVFESLFQRRGLYILDEPEAALSFKSCLRLITVFNELVKLDGQVICATHSPVLAGTPGAQVLEINERGLEEKDWGNLELVDHWRRWMQHPQTYLDQLVDREDE